MMSEETTTPNCWIESIEPTSSDGIKKATISMKDHLAVIEVYGSELEITYRAMTIVNAFNSKYSQPIQIYKHEIIDLLKKALEKSNG